MNLPSRRSKSMKPGISPERPRPLLILGRTPNASDLALRRTLRAKEPGQTLIIADYQGSIASRLTERNKGNLHRSPLLWCDLANRRRPASLFRFRRSSGMKAALRAFLESCTHWLSAPVSQRTIEAAVDLGYRLADQGAIGLAALMRSLRRPELVHPLRREPGGNDELNRLAELLDWALRFPSVWALSEGNNPVDLGGALRAGGTIWIEMPYTHFERLEHQLVSRMVEAVLLDALLSLRDVEPGRIALLPPIILYGLPSTAPLPMAFARDVAAKQIGLFRFEASYPLSAAARPWLDIDADCWVAGEIGTLPAGGKTDWLSETECIRLKNLEFGQVWVRSGVDRKAVTMLARRAETCASLAHGYRNQALKRLRLTPVKQFSTALANVEPPVPLNADLYSTLCTKEALLAGWFRVKTHNRHSHGSDRVTIDQFGGTLETQLDLLVSELAQGRYRSRPLRTVRIPKPDGDYRVLRIACVRDRVAQAAFLHVVEPLFDRRFSPSSFAYRPGRNAHQAVALVRSFIRSGKQWAVTADIRKCFDTVDHDILLRLVGDVVADRDMIRLLRHWITADIIDFMDIIPAELGIPQGEAISPLLANIYLDPLDKEFERNGIKFVRYADDYLVLCDTEPEAQAALRLMKEFLQGVLQMTLKPAKTQYCRVDQGVAFLGLEIGLGDDVRIPDDKVARAIAVVGKLAATLASPATASDEKWRATTRINDLIRGFRNYFLIDTAPLIRAQLSKMDSAVEAAAADQFKAQSDSAFVWACREKFLDAAHASEAAADATSLTGTYPLEGQPSRLDTPQVSDAGEERFKTPLAETVVVAPAQVNSLSEGGADVGAAIVVEGRLHVMDSGCYVTISGDELLVRKKRREVFRIPISDVTTVYLEGKGLALSADLTMRLCDADIPVIFTPLIGVPSAIAQPVQSMRSNVRRQQVLRREDPDIIKTGFAMLAAKVANQASALKYFARYRKRTDAAVYAALTRSAGEIRDIAAMIDGLDPGAVAARALGMGHEGRAAAKYWTSLASLIPGELSFPGRHTRYATDPVNSAVNYVYSLLYGEVWRSVVRAGLDPYFGIMHGSERDQGSLVFDMIEEYRAPFADRVVVGMLGRSFHLELDAEGRLRNGCRRKLVSAFHKQWHREVRWRGRMRAPSDILDAQATCLRNTFLGNDEYRPFRFQW
jgi:group II intron reverse transcriptase/maturase/CRISPR-associated endonuclease Cas1